MAVQKLPDYLIPLAAKSGVQPFFGDIHNHCNLSYGHGSLSNALRNAQRQLDFVSITGHAYWPDMPVNDPSVKHIVKFHVEGFERLKKLWPKHFETLSKFHKPGSFTVFPGYEMHSNAHGDYTIVYRDLDQRNMHKCPSPVELLNALRDDYGDRAFAFPHHIGYRLGARGINWTSFQKELSPVIELISMHGCSESSLTDRPFLHSMGPSDGINTIHNGWNSGHIFGVLGNTDHHSGYPGSYGHGRSAVYSSKNTSNDLWGAIRARHTNALTGDNCHLFATLNDFRLGDIVPPMDETLLNIEAVAGGFIDYIDVIKNGSIVARVSPAITPNPINNEEQYLETILMLELGWGARGSYCDWSGNLSLRAGEILAVEPRLRGPDVVSPLEGEEQLNQDTVAWNESDVQFKIRSYANPNNTTPTTQAIALRVRLSPDAMVKAKLCDQEIEFPASRLLMSALSGNLGAIDTPAFRFHPLPKEKDWQWHGSLDAGAIKKGDWISLRMRQTNGQWVWSSAFFCR